MLSSRTLLSVLLVFLSLSPVWGGDWQSTDPDVSLGHFPAKLVDDLPHLFIPDNIAPFAVGGVATAVDWATLDNQDSLASYLQGWHAQPLFNFGDFYGEGWVEGGTALGCWGIGALADNLKVQEFGRDTAESLVDSVVFVEAVKVAVNRTRPNGNSDSFPSGHSITAFCIAPVVMKYWGTQAGVEAYALATLTGFARVEGDYHYLSDVLAGATLGIIVGNAVVYSPKDVKMTVGPGEIGLTMAFN